MRTLIVHPLSLLSSYITNIRGMITSAHQISDEFHLLFNDGGSQHAYVALIASMNTGHDTLASEQVLAAFLEQVRAWIACNTYVC